MASGPVIDADPEHARLTVLQSYCIIDTPPETQFDAIVKRAADQCKTAAAALVLVDKRRCWFKARIGIEQTEMERHLSFCNHVSHSTGMLVVPDTRRDPRFSLLPMVAQDGFNFFAGTPLVTPYGHSIGSLWVLDYEPRELSAAQIAALKMLSAQAMDLFEQHRANSSPTPASTSPMAVPAKQAGSGENLLIVDDDDAVRSFVCVATRRLGYQVLEAANGVEALKQLEQNPDKIRLVLTDVNMPLMDGVELVKALKKHPAHPGIAVMSGRFDSYIRDALQAEGISALLSKPFSTEALKTTLLKAAAMRI